MVLFFFAISIIYGSLFKKLRGREKKNKRKWKLKSDGFNLFWAKARITMSKIVLHSYTPNVWSPLINSL